MEICKSCGIPMGLDTDFGTNADESLNEDYCSYCYQKGAFTNDVTMDGNN